MVLLIILLLICFGAIAYFFYKRHEDRVLFENLEKEFDFYQQKTRELQDEVIELKRDGIKRTHDFSGELEKILRYAASPSERRKQQREGE